MRLVIISDTHGKHRQITIPNGDVLIHCGDITGNGQMSIIEDFADWFKQFPHKKICIFGNHEVGMEYGYKRKPAIKLIEGAGAIYLEDSGVDMDGIKFWGSPVSPRFYNWEFNRDRGPDIRKHWDMIPEDTNVLITHGPPYKILDEAPRGIGDIEHVGCEDLFRRLDDLKQLKAHLFGHIHNAHGSKEINGVKFVNASSCNEQYQAVNKPIVVEI